MLQVPETHFVLRRDDNRKIVEMIIERMKCHILKGLDYLDTMFSLHKFNIKDHVSESKLYPNLVETHI